MMHLPALTMTDQIRKMISAVGKFGLAVRGIYGEGTEVLGNIYQLSNQITLGHSEEEIIRHLYKVTQQVLEHERAARERILAKDRLQLEDRIYRSYGILANAADDRDPRSDAAAFRCPPRHRPGDRHRHRTEDPSRAHGDDPTGASAKADGSRARCSRPG